MRTGLTGASTGDPVDDRGAAVQPLSLLVLSERQRSGVRDSLPLC
jgi:hypothetical protein